MNTEPVQAPAEAQPDDKKILPVDTATAVDLMADAPLITDGEDVAIANESFIRENFPIVGQALDSIVGLLKTLTPIEKVLGDQQRLQGIVGNVDYMSLGPLLVDVPEGLNTDYLTYLTVVEQLYEHAAQVETVLLDPLQRHLAQLVSSPTARYTFNPALDKQVREFSRERDQIRSQLDKCFTNSGKSKIHYQKAFRRNGDWRDIYATAERIMKLSELDTTRIMKKAEQISELSDTLVKLNASGELPTMDAKTFEATRFMMQAAAEEVSMISIAYYHGKAGTTALSLVVKQLIKNYG